MSRWASGSGYWVEATELSASKPIPPGCMLDFPVFFERAWGYDRLFPCHVTEDDPEIHAYIEEFYRRNCSVAPSVATSATLCLKMEHGLKSEWLARGVSVTPEELELSNAIHERALNLLVGHKADAVSTFPYVAMCIAKEAELIIERLRRGFIDVYEVEHSLSTNIRRHALELMTTEGASGSASPTATDMMVLSALTGIAKEAELICEEMKKKRGSRQEVDRCREIQAFALDVMTQQLDEYAVAANSATERSREEYAVWKRNLIATIEQGDPTWADTLAESFSKGDAEESLSDYLEEDLISKWRIKGSHRSETPIKNRVGATEDLYA